MSETAKTFCGFLALFYVFYFKDWTAEKKTFTQYFYFISV